MKSRARGTTLVELMMTLVFLAISASAMLGAVAGSQRNADLAKYKLIALSLAEDQIELARRDALAGSLASGTASSTSSTTGVPYQVTVTRTVTLVTGTTDLYTVSASAIWNELGKDHGAVLVTMMRSPDA